MQSSSIRREIEASFPRDWLNFSMAMCRGSSELFNQKTQKLPEFIIL